MSALELSGAQRKYLRGLAHELKPVALLGKGGLSDGLVDSIDQALESHELIKLKLNDLKDEKAAIADELAERLGAGRVGIIGHVVMLYRPAREHKDRKIRLPERG